MRNAGSAAASMSGEAHVALNGEDDATRCGRKGPDSATALARILCDLYKGEEEEFLHIKPWDGFSMYNPPSWVSRHPSPLFIHSGVLRQEYLPRYFRAGTEEGRRRILQPLPAARGPQKGLRSRTRRRPGYYCGAHQRDILSGELRWCLSGYHCRLSRTATSIACKQG